MCNFMTNSLKIFYKTTDQMLVAFYLIDSEVT